MENISLLSQSEVTYDKTNEESRCKAERRNGFNEREANTELFQNINSNILRQYYTNKYNIMAYPDGGFTKLNRKSLNVRNSSSNNPNTPGLNGYGDSEAIDFFNYDVNTNSTLNSVYYSFCCNTEHYVSKRGRLGTLNDCLHGYYKANGCNVCHYEEDTKWFRIQKQDETITNFMNEYFKKIGFKEGLQEAKEHWKSGFSIKMCEVNNKKLHPDKVKEWSRHTFNLKENFTHILYDEDGNSITVELNPYIKNNGQTFELICKSKNNKDVDMYSNNDKLIGIKVKFKSKKGGKEREIEIKQNNSDNDDIYKQINKVILQLRPFENNKGEELKNGVLVVNNGFILTPNPLQTSGNKDHGDYLEQYNGYRINPFYFMDDKQNDLHFDLPQNKSKTKFKPSCVFKPQLEALMKQLTKNMKEKSLRRNPNPPPQSQTPLSTLTPQTPLPIPSLQSQTPPPTLTPLNDSSSHKNITAKTETEVFQMELNNKKCPTCGTPFNPNSKHKYQLSHIDSVHERPDLSNNPENLLFECHACNNTSGREKDILTRALNKYKSVDDSHFKSIILKIYNDRKRFPDEWVEDPTQEGQNRIPNDTCMKIIRNSGIYEKADPSLPYTLEERQKLMDKLESYLE